MTIRSRVGALSAATVLTFGVAACGSTSTPAGSASSSSPSIAMSSASATATPTTSAPLTMASSNPAMSMPSAPTGPHNEADVTFAQMMLVHHRGAIEMADLAPTRAAGGQVKDLAVKIEAAQTPEIAEMKGWLAAWMPAMGSSGMPMSSSKMGSMTGMNHGGSSSSAMPGMMPGMMSPADMDKLKGASGAAFDKMFLEMMIKHHQGAIEMAKTEKSSGQNPAALKLAASIIASQTAEITTMQNLLKGM